MVTTIQTSTITAVTKALGLRFDAAPAWKFYVEVMGVLVAEFQECSGLTMERDVKEVKEGGTNDFEWLLPGRIKYGPITLKKGVTYNRELWRWFRAGRVERERRSLLGARGLAEQPDEESVLRIGSARRRDLRPR